MHPSIISKLSTTIQALLIIMDELVRLPSLHTQPAVKHELEATMRSLIDMRENLNKIKKLRVPSLMADVLTFTPKGSA